MRPNPGGREYHAGHDHQPSPQMRIITGTAFVQNPEARSSNRRLRYTPPIARSCKRFAGIAGVHPPTRLWPLSFEGPKEEAVRLRLIAGGRPIPEHGPCPDRAKHFISHLRNLSSLRK